MAPATRQARGVRGRAPGQLFAEVALVVVLLAGLGLSWPASRPLGVPPPASLAIPAWTLAAPGSRGEQAEDDLGPPRNFRWWVPTAPNPMPDAPPAVSAPPIQLFISSLNLHPLVESVSVDRSGAMSAPRNYFDVAWYNLGPVPGDPGDAVIDGHAGYPDQPLVFAKLDQLRAGDRIVVVLADFSRRVFTVRSVKSWPWFAHPTGLFQGDGPARLTLITCSGTFNDQTHSYHDRLVVEATYAGNV
jgi:hypothetical protein